MSKKSKQHTVYSRFTEDKHGRTPYLAQWEGKREQYSDDEITRVDHKRHNQKNGSNQGQEFIGTNKRKIWRRIKNIGWWVGSYTIAVIKFLFTLSWKIIVIFFVVFIGQILLGLLLSR